MREKHKHKAYVSLYIAHYKQGLRRNVDLSERQLIIISENIIHYNKD
jgi:hypothetical protein